MKHDIKNNKFIAEDIRTIHAEIKQIINQRYSIITVSITLLGLFITCITQVEKLGINNLFAEPAYFIGLFFLLLLLLMNLYTRILTKQLMTLSCFLVVFDLSTYEKYWGLYPRTKMTGYSHIQKMFFYILAILILVICFLYTYSVEEYICLQNVLSFFTLLILYIVVLELTNKMIINKKVIERIKNNWKETIENNDENSFC
ncbi:hypothetical protein LJC72_07100 [Bacteroides sp. OttesenSCG-928-D19]|nr:hypothetical protein [Bacteroides sp. OttesenSCG-928-D19]